MSPGRLHPCAKPGCPELVSGGARCEQHRREYVRQHVEPRREKTAARGYGSKWRRARGAHLRRRPLCEDCGATGRVTQATQGDHVVPIAAMEAAGLRPHQAGNVSPVCDRCHERRTVVFDQLGRTAEKVAHVAQVRAQAAEHLGEAYRVQPPAWPPAGGPPGSKSPPGSGS